MDIPLSSWEICALLPPETAVSRDSLSAGGFVEVVRVFVWSGAHVEVARLEPSAETPGKNLLDFTSPSNVGVDDGAQEPIERDILLL